MRSMVQAFGVHLLIVPMILLGALLFLHASRAADPDASQAALAGRSDYERGEYYFNRHVSSSNEAYDRSLARYYYTKALGDDPRGYEEGWYHLGRIDFIEGKFDDALRKFERQLAYFPTSTPNVYYMIGLSHGYRARLSGDPGDWERAEDAFLAYIGIAPHEPWPRVDLAWAYFAQGKFQDMLPVLETGLADDPENPWLLNMYGLTLMNIGDSEEAVTQFKAAQRHAQLLTAADWGRTYPGNDPADWPAGLAEFQNVIDKNIEIAQQRAAE